MDELLNVPTPSASGPTDWVRQHRSRLLQAHARAYDCLLEEAANRKSAADAGAKEHALQVGDLVYLRNRVAGRAKVQDKWRPTLHVVTSRPYPGSHVYCVCPRDGGLEKVLGRRDLLPARPPFPTMQETRNPVPDKDSAGRATNELQATERPRRQSSRSTAGCRIFHFGDGFPYI